MIRGIKRKTKAIYIKISEGIEVNSSILSEAVETNNANIVNMIGRSLDCHLLIFIKYKNNGKNISGNKQINLLREICCPIPKGRYFIAF